MRRPRFTLRILLASAALILMSSVLPFQLSAAEFEFRPALRNAVTPPGRGADEYQIDDGSGERHFSIPGGNSTMVILNQFNVIAGAELITSIRIAWGDIPEGSNVTVLLFGDPNDDGNPDDIGPSSFLYSAVELMDDGEDSLFVEYPVPSVDVGKVGDSFFIVACIPQTMGQVFCAQDQHTVTGRSWYGGAQGTLDCSAVDIEGLAFDNMGSGHPLPGTWMIRASGIAATPVIESSWGRVKADFASE